MSLFGNKQRIAIWDKQEMVNHRQGGRVKGKVSFSEVSGGNWGGLFIGEGNDFEGVVDFHQLQGIGSAVAGAGRDPSSFF